MSRDLNSNSPSRLMLSLLLTRLFLASELVQSSTPSPVQSFQLSNSLARPCGQESCETVVR